MRCDFDESWMPIAVRPIKAQDFLSTQSSKSRQCNTCRNLWRSVFQKCRKLGGREDFNRCWFPVAFFDTTKQINFFRQPIVFLRKPEERPQRTQEIIVTA